MKKVIVIGCPGSGKSTFSKSLSTATGLPLYHLDMMNWNTDGTTVPKSVFTERLHQVLNKESWIIDGNYGSTMELRMRFCDTIFFLDYPTEVCLDGIKARKGKQRSDMPCKLTEDDNEFIEFINNYNTASRPKVMKLLRRYSCKKIYIFKSRNKADEFLSSIE